MAGRSERDGKAAASGTTAKRQRRNLLVAAGVLVVALVAYLVLPGLLATDDEVQSESLLGISADEVTSLTWTNAEGSFGLALEDGSWSIPDEPEAELKSTDIDELVDSLAEATVERTIDAADVDSEMGLESPSYKASIGLSSGEVVTLAVGAETSDGASNYVLVGDGDGAFVCGSEVASALATTAQDLYARESGPSASELSELVIAAGGNSVTLTKYEGGNSELSYTTSYEWFVSDGTDTQAVTTSDASSIMEIVNNPSWLSVVDATWDGSGSYGFDEPTLTATLDYVQTSTEETTNDEGETEYETVETPGTFVLVVGSQASDGSYYAQPEGSSRVYTLAASDIEELLAASPETLVPDDVVLMDWDSVEELSLTVDGTTTTVTFVREDDADASADESDSDEAATSDSSDEDASSDDATSYEIEGEEASASKVEAIMDAIDALSAEGEATGAPEDSDPSVTISFQRSTDGWEEMTLTLTRYDSNYYLASFNGRNDQLIGRAEVRTLTDAIAALAE